MLHRRLRRKLGVKTHHRKALLRNLVRHLVIYKRIQTTYAKAKEASAFADRMVQIAKEGGLHSRRLLISKLGNSQIAHDLITKVAPHFKERKGGYTRVLRLDKPRVGDTAEMAVLEFTALIEAPEKKKPKKEKSKKPQEISHKEISEEKPKKEKESRKEEKKAPASEKETSDKEKKESEKKGGFLSGLRKFFKGDDEK